MAIATAQVAVSTTAAELTAGLTAYTGDMQSIAVQAPAAAVLYIGNSGVTSANGFPIAAGTSVSLELEYGERLYGILASGTGTAFTLRTSAL